MNRIVLSACLFLVGGMTAVAQPGGPPEELGETSWCAKEQIGSSNGVFYYSCWTYTSGVGCADPSGFGVMNIDCTPGCTSSGCACEPNPGMAPDEGPEGSGAHDGPDVPNATEGLQDAASQSYPAWDYEQGAAIIEEIKEAVESRIGTSGPRRGGPAPTFGRQTNRGKAYQQRDSNNQSWKQYMEQFEAWYDSAGPNEQQERLKELTREGGYLDTIRGFALRVSSAGFYSSEGPVWGQEGSAGQTAKSDTDTSFVPATGVTVRDASPAGWEKVPADDALRSQVVRFRDKLIKLYAFQAGNSARTVYVGTQVAKTNRSETPNATVAGVGSFKHTLKLGSNYYVVNTYDEIGSNSTCHLKVEEIVAPK